MIMIGFRRTEINPKITKLIKEVKPGGLILMDYDLPSKGQIPRNIVNPEQTKQLIKDLQLASDTPLLIAVDAEGGLVNRLKPKYGFIDVPSAEKMGEGTPGDTKRIATELAKQLKNLGFNTNLAPVVDVNVDEASPAIGALGRSFSSDPNLVIAHAREFINAHKQESIITVLKHFPGHGSAGEDSHLELVDVTNTYQKEELIPYQVLEADAVMTAHIMNKNEDPDYPATLSKIFLENILRNELNFTGVIFSDDMQMAAIRDIYGFEKAIIKAVNAGNDIILSSNNIEFNEDEAYKIRDIILEGAKNGKIPLSRIIESSDRIYNLKEKYNLGIIPGN
jgi:beta-N-acetylhexosaminidase